MTRDKVKADRSTTEALADMTGRGQSSTPEDPLPYAESLMRQNYEAVGFIPRPRMEQYALRGQLLVETENGDPCGYLVFGAEAWPYMRVYQAVIQYDARRREHGLALVARLVAIGRERGAAAISLWCADGLEANDFWKSVGFRFAGKRDGSKTFRGRVGVRGRRHNRWLLTLAPGLFEDGS